MENEIVFPSEIQSVLEEELFVLYTSVNKFFKVFPEENNTLTAYCHNTDLIAGLYLDKSLPSRIYQSSLLLRMSDELKEKLISKKLFLDTKENRPKVKLYVDASFKKIRYEKLTAYGFVLVKNDEILRRGGELCKSELKGSQDAEVLGMERILRKLENDGYFVDEIYCDNKHAIKISNKVWNIREKYEEITKTAYVRLRKQHDEINKTWIPKYKNNKFHKMAHNLAYNTLQNELKSK